MLWSKLPLFHLKKEKKKRYHGWNQISIIGDLVTMCIMWPEKLKEKKEEKRLAIFFDPIRFFYIYIPQNVKIIASMWHELPLYATNLLSCVTFFSFSFLIPRGTCNTLLVTCTTIGARLFLG